MKRLLSFCLALCVCLSLLISFSVTANAEAFTDFYIVHEGRLIDKENETIYENGMRFEANNGEQEKLEDVYNVTDNTVVRGQLNYHTSWRIWALDGYPLSLGRVNTLKFENFYHRVLCHAGSFGNRYFNDWSELYAVVTYVDNTTERFELSGTIDTDMSLDMSFNFTPEKNVKDITLHAILPLHEKYNNNALGFEGSITFYYGEIKGDDKHQFNIDIQSEEAGLLSGLLGWVKNIFNKIGDIAQAIIDLPQKIWNSIKQGFDALGESLTNVWNTLIELPEKLWNLISEGLQFLFVPTQDDFDQFQSNAQDSLASGLGAVWEVALMTFDSWNDILNSDATNSIEFPLTEISLPDNNSFSFGGYTVKVVPDGFENIVVVLKSLVGIVCTLSFVNALKKRYEEMMG